ncbi:DUF6776 family protein [Phytopseudomonas dryadis]|uniref:Uncharacterized protein n=1 Tax=Phytopseudomonas dryadis TaxID=2487520 RepID=A0A4Q9QWQ5_9GAMM|nr:DUF6776 family protein [Pseudomonas dryadis]TBU88618.1 hypothetical protein DNK44_17960 [Pseudomonas dryadis]
MLVLLLMAAPAAFYLGVWWQGKRLQAQLSDMQPLQDRLDEQVRELDELRQRLAVVGSGATLAQQANEQSRLTIKLLEEQIFKQQQDLAFYKGVLAPDSRSEGLLIRTFELQRTDQAQRFRYKLLLSRVGKDDKPLQGRLQVLLEGRQDKAAAILPLARLTSDLPEDSSEAAIAFAFKHFQAIPEGGRLGELQLPRGFEPEQVRVRAEVEGEKPVERVFKWID